MSSARTWGTDAPERARTFPCDAHLHSMLSRGQQCQRQKYATGQRAYQRDGEK